MRKWKVESSAQSNTTKWKCSSIEECIAMVIPLINPSAISNKLENFNFIFIYSSILGGWNLDPWYDDDVLQLPHAAPFFSSRPGCGSLWVRVFSFPLFAFFWGIFARIFRSFSIYNGVSNLKSVGLAVCRFDCSLHRCQLATVRLAAFQWNYRWCFRSPPP